MDWLLALVSQSCEGSETEGKAFVDTFALCHGAACLGRYTQWNHIANSRFLNLGARLDYILCDTSMRQAQRSNAGGRRKFASLGISSNRPSAKAEAFGEDSDLGAGRLIVATCSRDSRG